MRPPIEVRNPRTGAMDHEIAPLDAGDLAERAAALRAAQVRWAARPLAERIAVLRRWRAALEADRQRIVDALAADTGRRAVSRVEMDGVLGMIERWCAQAPALIDALAAKGRSAAMPELSYATQLVAYPLVGAISPWNFPLTLSLIDAVPALLAGCAVLLKPSEVTPRFADPLEASLAGVPALAEVFSIARGDGETGAALVETVDAVCFTGSVATGRKVAATAAQTMIPAFLELGGKDPAVVLGGADIERAAAAILRASLANTGQACQSIERIYAARPLHDDLVAALVVGANAVPLSYPDPDSGVLGPIIFARQAEILRAQLADAVAKGAEIRCGGDIETLGGGLWLRPTVLTGVTHDMALMREETFGPILPVMAFGSVDEAVALANDSDYGLSAAVLGPGASAVAARLDAGAVSIDDAGLTTVMYEAEKTSFRLSGLGASRMGPSGMARFLRKKALLTNTGPVMPLAAFAEGG